MKSKLYAVRVPGPEVEIWEALRGQFPGASPALIVRALVNSAKIVQLQNAVAKLAADNARKGSAS